ncbi:MAG: hypothetical protein MJZ25_11065 [Fibrobacter sp.]|nr:hypothetical protein [Fibrobacter sp.]
MAKASENSELKGEFNELVKKIDEFIADYGDLDMESRSRKQEGFTILVRKYVKERCHSDSKVNRNERESLVTDQDKTVERFKKYRIRCSENSIAQLKDFYSFLLTLKGQVVPAQKLLPADNHPLKSSALVRMLRKVSQEMDKNIADVEKKR